MTESNKLLIFFDGLTKPRGVPDTKTGMLCFVGVEQTVFRLSTSSSLTFTSSNISKLFFEGEKLLQGSVKIMFSGLTIDSNFGIGLEFSLNCSADTDSSSSQFSDLNKARTALPLVWVLGWTGSSSELGALFIESGWRIRFFRYVLMAFFWKILKIASHPFVSSIWTACRQNGDPLSSHNLQMFKYQN